MTNPDTARGVLAPLAALMLMVALPNLTFAQHGKFVRPARFAPPVHAQPLRQPPRHVARAPRHQNQYPVRQVAATGQYIDQQAEQWRTRTQEVGDDTAQWLHSVADQDQSGMPALTHPSPQQQAPAQQQWSLNDTTPVQQMPAQIQPPQMMQSQQAVTQQYGMPDTAVPDLQYSNSAPHSMQQVQPYLNHAAPTYADPSWDQPALDEPNYAGETFDAFSDSPDIDADNYQSIPQDNSVLVRDDPQLNSNRLRDMQMEPRQMRSDAISNQQRTPVGNRRRVPATLTRQEIGEDPIEAQSLKTCDDYREELLNSPITDIIVDISPYGPSAAAQQYPAGMNRTWTDCTGRPLATGTLTGLRGSYVTINDDMGQLRLVPLSLLSDGDLAVVTEFWGLPTECTLGCDPFLGRHWACNTVLWKASALCHKPLYFENIQLERYGHTHGPFLEPVYSSAHFFCSLFLWPYNAGIHPPKECVYALGYYRPGDCAPWLKDPIPLSLEGAKNQAIAIGAAAAIIP